MRRACAGCEGQILFVGSPGWTVARHYCSNVDRHQYPRYQEAMIFGQVPLVTTCHFAETPSHRTGAARSLRWRRENCSQAAAKV
jgi:hypothetical protein